jgi:hypothetical protein
MIRLSLAAAKTDREICELILHDPERRLRLHVGAFPSDAFMSVKMGTLRESQLYMV